MNPLPLVLVLVVVLGFAGFFEDENENEEEDEPASGCKFAPAPCDPQPTRRIHNHPLGMDWLLKPPCFEGRQLKSRPG